MKKTESKKNKTDMNDLKEKEMDNISDDLNENSESMEELQENESINTDKDEKEIKSEIENEMNALLKENEDYKLHLQRLKAEFDNYRKKVNKERIDWANAGAIELFSKLLPIFSDFDRAFEHGIETEMEKGLKMVYDKMLDTLMKDGLEMIPSVGEEFDPNFHDALQMIDVTEGKDNHIVQEYEKGYIYKGRIVRHSKVIVGRLVGDSCSEEDSSENQTKQDSMSDENEQKKNKIDTKA